MKKQNKLLAFLLVFALLFSLMGNAALAVAPEEQYLQTQESASTPTDITTPTNLANPKFLDKDHVYITIYTDNGVAKGRSGNDILEYPIYALDENGDPLALTASDLLCRVHENEFHNILNGKGSNVNTNGAGAFTWIWGKEVTSFLYTFGGKKLSTADVYGSNSYYINIGSGLTSAIAPMDYSIITGQSLEMTANYWTEEGIIQPFDNADVYVGETIASATKVTTTAANGSFFVNFPNEGRFYVIVKNKDNSRNVHDAICSVVANAAPVAAPYNTFTKTDSIKQGDLYLVVAKDTSGKAYAFSYDSGLCAKEVTISGNTITTEDNTTKWYARPNDTFQTYLSDGEDVTDVFVYAGSQGLMTFSTGRVFAYQNGIIKLHTKFFLTFDGEKFGQTQTADEACQVELYAIDLPGNYDRVEFLPDGTNNKPVSRDAVKSNGNGKYTLAFVSDTHHAIDYDQINLEKWLEAVEEENDIDYIDAMGFCGDMGSAYSSTNEIYWQNVGSKTPGNVQSVLAYMDQYQDRSRDAVNGKIGTVIYTFGNHEWYPQAGGDFMHNYGVNETDYSTGEKGTNEVIDRFYRVGKAMETDKYIIYCLGAGGISAQLNSGYSEEDIDSIDNYLATAPDDKPIFVLVHFPLHIWGDRFCVNSDKVVNVLNRYADQGKNIVVLWGHNHSDFDENYDAVVRPGDKIVLDKDSKTKEDITTTVNFTYLSAGCISDSEYSGADGGSAWVQGKGVIVTFDDNWSSTNHNANMKFTYYTMDGKAIEEGGPYLVSFRDGVYYNKLKQVYVEPGKSVTPPEAPARVNYTFDKWDTDLSSINRHSLVTANYTYDSKLDKNYVYFTVTNAQGVVVKGKNGNSVLMYKIPYTKDMTALDAVKALHDAEYAYNPGESANNVYADPDQHGALSWVWGFKPNNGAWVFGAGSSNGYVAATDKVQPGESYYIALYNKTDTTNDAGEVTEKGDYLATSYLAPYISDVYVNEEVDFITKYYSFNPRNYKYTQVDFAGDVYIGTSPDIVDSTDVKSIDGKFTLSFDKAGTYYVVVKDNANPKAVADATCIVNVRQRVRPITDDTNSGSSSSGGGSSSGGSSGSGDNNPPADTTPAASEAVKPEAKADASGVAKAPVAAADINKAIDNVKANGGDSIVIAPEVSGDAKEVKVELPKAAVNDIAAGTDAALVVETDTASLEVPNDALEAITEQAGADVEISVAEKSVEDAGVKEAIADKFGDISTENAAVAEITVSSGNEKITSFDGKTINAKVSVEGKPGFVEGRKYHALVISENGRREIFAGKCARGANGKLSVGVKVGHLSTFVILDKEIKSFADAEAHWAADAVDYAVANELMNGTSDTTFAPNSTLNRAMLVTVLYRLAGSPAVAEAAKFADVAAGQWYTDAVAWAAANGIVTGKTETSFAPMENITREQFATMLMRYCKFAGIDTSAAGNLAAFADSATISAYAQDALAWANAAGIITGRTATTIAPTGNATRGEAATMLMRFLQM